MKRFLSLLLLFSLLLTGCRVPDDPIPTDPFPTEPEQTERSTEATEAPTRPPIQAPEPSDSDLVRVIDHIPGIRQSLAYATGENFTGASIYDFTDAYLRYGTVKKLQAVCRDLEEQGLGLLIWDGFRPVSAQARLWEICPDPNFVSHPVTGKRNHCRGNAIDLTLVDLDTGEPLSMPTGFDDFSAQADRDYADCGPEAAANALILQEAMERHGLIGYSKEWWHYTDETDYEVVEDFEPQTVSAWYAECNEFISLRTAPDTGAPVITTIPAGEALRLLAKTGDFAFVEYEGVQGFVLRSYIRPVGFGSGVPTDWVANCEEYISLRSSAGGTDTIGKIPAGDSLELLGWSGKYARVTWKGLEGYVFSSYITPADDDLLSLSVVEPTDCYTHAQMLADLKTLAERYPQAELDSIGASELGRDIPVLRIGDPDAPRQVLIQGSIHGREHMTAWLVTAMADYWLEHGVPEGVCYHIIPMTNPDGVTISQTGTLNDAQSDIYGRDLLHFNAGLDRREYARRWKANGLGVDINRNFPAGWELIDDRDAPSSEKYRGEAPFSTAEAAALRDYTLAHEFDVTISYHSQGSEIYYEYGDRQPVNDQSLSLARAVESVTGYPPMGSSGLDGAGYKDWVMNELGIPSLTIEVGCEDSPLHRRELDSIFARNVHVIPAIALWLD